MEFPVPSPPTANAPRRAGGAPLRPRIAALLPVAVAVMLATTGCTVMEPPVRPSNGAWRLSGTVISSTGGPIAGALFTVQDSANRDAQVISDASGRYVFASLESGRFRMVIDAHGFQSVAPVIDLYQDLEVDFALRRAE
jgi:hypothetical protein